MYAEPLEAPPEPLPAEKATDRPKANWLWAELMQRSFGCDVLACPRCGGRLQLIALIEDPLVVLAHDRRAEPVVCTR